MLPPPAGVCSAALLVAGASGEELPPVDGVPSAAPGDGLAALLNTWFAAEVLPLNVEPEMLGKELFKKNTGPCCAVLLLKVQLAMLASWQLFCSQQASCQSCLHACLSSTALEKYVAASIEG